MKRFFNRYLALLAMATLAIASAAPAQDVNNFQPALNRSVSLTIADAPISEVFQKLAQVTGVRFVIDADTLALLPYGAQTHLAVTLQNITLRDALSRLLAPSALRWTLEKDGVHIVPGEALYRMTRRATFDELQLLGKLNTGRLEPGKPVLEQLRQMTANPDLSLAFRLGEVSQEQVDRAAERAGKTLPASPADYLDMLTAPNDWTWYVWSNDIVILPRVKQVDRQLQKQVSLRYQNTQIESVLLDLARQARVQLEMAPGVLSTLPPDVRSNFNLMMADASVAQALEVISGATGLTFERTPQGILVQPSASAVGQGQATASVGGATTPATQPGRRFFVRMNVPVNGTIVEVYLRAEELPPDVVEKIEAAKAQLIEQIRAGAQPQQ